MISKEKKILFENFNRKSIKRDYTDNLMNRMLDFKKKKIRQSRQEEYLNNVEEWKKQGETFDISKMGFSQKERLSPTSKSNVRSFRNLHEQRMYEDSIELQEILKELEE